MGVPTGPGVEDTIHLAVRYADHLAGGIDTITEHRNVLDRQGCVWFGKIGRGLGRATVERLNRQIREGKPTYVYLVTRADGGSYRLNRGRLRTIQANTPNRQTAKIPAYYGRTSSVKGYIGLWCLLESLAEVNTAERKLLYVQSSGRALVHTLNTSMAAAFIIKRGTPPVSSKDAAHKWLEMMAEDWDDEWLE